MQKIALPQKIEFVKGEAPSQGVVMIEPCYPGYGITLGNSLRRVLLSSLPGAAVIGVKIKGADHEFMTLPHVKEDILEIILNLKQLRMRLHTDELVKLELDVHGEKAVKASDISKNSDVEIANPDMLIANVTDMAGKLTMEIFVSSGRGYETIESREAQKNELGYIETDSVFSPVVSVGMSVENVRVGKMTNWEKLILNITTDGTITPEESFNRAVDILIEQFNALRTMEIKGEKKEEAEAEEEAEVAVETAEEATESEDESGQEKKKRGRPKKS